MMNFIANAKEGLITGKKLLLGKIEYFLANKIEQGIGLDFDGFNVELRSYYIRHIFSAHGDEDTETSRGQRAVIL